MTLVRGQHLIGKVLGSCTLERLLGYGGSSAVFLAQQADPERKVAIKVFLPRTGMDRRMQKDFYRRFLREAEAASKLDHPNILPIYSYGEQEGLPYIIMPYMPGGTLTEFLSKRGPLSLKEAQWYLEQLASALDYAHEHGCIHCDVKPANILLDSQGHVMLSDFGIARLTHSETEAEHAENRSPDSLVGTPDYVSPEQALGRPLDGRSDLYSLAVTLFFLLTKRLPFRADSTIALALLHVHENPPSLAMLRADITPALDHIMHKALAKNPDERFQSVGDFSVAFANAIPADEKKVPGTRNKHDNLLAGKMYDQSPGLQPGALTPRPIISIRPIKQRHNTVPRLLVSGIVLLCLVLVIGYTLSSMFYHPAHGKSNARTASTVITTPTPSDLLAGADNWPTSSTFFFDSARLHYHILNNSEKGVALATYNDHQFSNFRLNVTLTEVHNPTGGPDYAGVVFRAASDQSHYYLFEIAPSENTQYAFLRYNGGGKWNAIKTGTIATLHSGPDSSNIITIQAQGNNFTFLINEKPLDVIMNDPEPSPLLLGEIGLYVENQGTEVAFSRLYITSL